MKKNILEERKLQILNFDFPGYRDYPFEDFAVKPTNQTQRSRVVLRNLIENKYRTKNGFSSKLVCLLI